MRGGRRSRILILAAAAWGFARANAGWEDFAPRPFENGAYVEVFGAREIEDSNNAGRPVGWKDLFFRETVTFFSNGYFYHPRFLQYQFSIGGGLKQEQYRPTTGTELGWQHDGSLEYNARLFFLPEHAYHLELFALRYEPLYKEQASSQHGNVETSNGGHFRYKRKPFFLHAGIVDNTTSTSGTSSRVTRFNLDGEYFKQFGKANVFSVTGSFIPTRFNASLGLEGDSSQYSVDTLLSMPVARLSASATRNFYDQDSPLSGRLENDQFLFQERLNLFLPVHFRVDAYYRLLDNKSTTFDAATPSGRELQDNDKDVQAILSHRLYESLDSRYTFMRNVRRSSDGTSDSLSNTLGFDYNKSIPRGRVQVGLSAGTTRIDSSGRPDVVSEPHSGVAVPGTFTLSQPNVIQGSVVVYLHSPLPPFQLVTLVENVHYVLNPVGNTLEVRLLTLPPQFAVPGTYDFLATFSLTAGTFELRTDTYSVNASVPLLENLVTPYAGYVAIRSDTLAGVFPGIPLDSTTSTLGVTVQEDPFRSTAEYQDVNWSVNPFRAWRIEVQFVQTLDPTLRVYASAQALWKYFPDGNAEAGSAAYWDNSATLTGSVQKDWLSHTLVLYGGGSYSRMSGIVDSEAYTVNSSLTYRVGKLDLNAGIDVYGSSSRSVGYGSYDRDHQYFYLRLRRRLF